MSKVFPAKLLLFGEYTVLLGSQALAIPLMTYQGQWVRSKSKAQLMENNKTFFEWLKNNNLLSKNVYNQITSDQSDGWQFNSNIPAGFGLGSSGAWVAAVYDRYFPDDPSSRQEIMSKMEGYYHGVSSGMDPMVSYTAQAVLKDDQGSMQVVPNPGWPEGFRVYLLNSGIERTTEPLVKYFRQLCAEENFRKEIEQELIPMVEHAIHFYLTGSGIMLGECLSMISHFQRRYFIDFIPEQISQHWDVLTNVPGTYVKLCGAGGGGYFLVITNTTNELPFSDMLIRIN